MPSHYCESTFICWHQFLWFLKNALIHGFLNSWFQTLHATINCMLFDFYFRGLIEPGNPRKLEPNV